VDYGFSSEVVDRDLGLSYYNFRYYDANQGRWLSRDPIEEMGGENLYAMIGNDAVGQWDILGLQTAAEKKGWCRMVLQDVNDIEMSYGADTSYIFVPFEEWEPNDVNVEKGESFDDLFKPKNEIDMPKFKKLLKNVVKAARKFGLKELVKGVHKLNSGYGFRGVELRATYDAIYTIYYHDGTRWCKNNRDETKVELALIKDAAKVAKNGVIIGLRGIDDIVHYEKEIKSLLDPLPKMDMQHKIIDATIAELKDLGKHTGCEKWVR